MQEKEVWKDVPGYEGYYQVSSFGRVRSLERYVNFYRGKRIVRERILKEYLNGYGYYSVCLFKKGKGSTIETHRLVIKAFVNKNIRNQCGLVVNHIDFNRTNNKLNNLVIIN